MEEIKRIKTGIENLDDKILGGGIPTYSVNIIGGTPGSGKTILTQQILFNNASPKTRTIYFTTVSEPTAKLIHYQRSFDYFDEQKVRDGVVSYVDIGHIIHRDGLQAGIEAITAAIDKHSASIVAIDSFKAVNELAESISAFRQFAYRLCVELIAWRCTSFLVGEYNQEALEKEPIFAVADGIIHLDNKIQGVQNRRTLQITKMRGVNYFDGIHSLSISKKGIDVFPRAKTPPKLSFEHLGERKISTGVSGLNEMTASGLPLGSSTLVAGGAGTGKTTLALHFLMNGVKNKEPGLMVTYQETPDQLEIIGKGFGWNLKKYEEEGLLKIIYTSPVELDIDEHAIAIKKAVEEGSLKRVVIDNLRDIEIVANNTVRYHDYVYSLVNFFKSKTITSILTTETEELFGVPRLSSGISFIADNVILLNYMNVESVIKRAMTVLKVRGSDHDKEIKEFVITSAGMEVKI
ncbi:MAG: ATPase domain-containing protein [bacterium]